MIRWTRKRLFMACSAAAVAVVLLVLFVSSRRNLTSLEAGLIQAIELAIGIVSSYAFARVSANKSSQDLVETRAKSGLRRVLGMYRALARLAESIEMRRIKLRESTEPLDGLVRLNLVEASLDLLDAQVREQIGTANDAVEDWKDLVSEEDLKMIIEGTEGSGYVG